MSRAAVRCLVMLACLAAPGAGFAQSPITIRVYDAAGGSGAERAGAIGAAAAIFADAGLRIIWRDCGPQGADHPCTDVRLPRDMVVRIVPRAVVAEVPASRAVSADGDVDTERDAAAEPVLRLGAAALAPADRSGVVATVYADHVRSVTRRTGVQFALLLGRAIAHEIGHLLPGGDEHTATGLMRAVWTDGELRQNRPEDWIYSPGVSASASPRTPRSR